MQLRAQRQFAGSCSLTLVPACPCSGLEDARLNYVEQHAERLGVDTGRLEGARVAAAQGGPAGETLDLCARCVRRARRWSGAQASHGSMLGCRAAVNGCLVVRYADVATMTELAPKLAALVRRGVGVNTRAGAGRFVTQVRCRQSSHAVVVQRRLCVAGLPPLTCNERTERVSVSRLVQVTRRLGSDLQPLASQLIRVRTPQNFFCLTRRAG